MAKLENVNIEKNLSEIFEKIIDELIQVMVNDVDYCYNANFCPDSK